MAQCPDCAGSEHGCDRCEHGQLPLSQLSIEERATQEGADLDVEHVYKPGGVGEAEYKAARKEAKAAARAAADSD